MTTKPFHLAWFGNFASPDWMGNWPGHDAETWMDGSFYIDMVKSLERACFDYMMLEDSVMVPDLYKGTAEGELKYAKYAPKLDPAPLVPLLAQATKHIGVVATLSTTFYPPYLLARLTNTLDHLARGRAGWNVVTSSEDRAAQNFGMDKLPEHDLRYDKAEEFVGLVKKLWGTWEKDAVVLDRETGVHTDFTKVHKIDFEGEFYKSRGPLNTPRSPQGEPVICQAGGSEKGREFAARNADVLLAIPKGVKAMKEYRDDIRRRAEAAGRDPDHIKVMYVISPFLADTVEAAEAMRDDFNNDPRNIEIQMVHMAATSEVDLSAYPLDEPLPETGITTNGHQSSLNQFLASAKGKTLREALRGRRPEAVSLAGTPDSVAEEMGSIMEEVGGDGFLFYNQPLTRRYIGEIADGLVPALQRRGLTRTSYKYDTLRENLREF